jgi:hypothetical protein
MFGGEPPVENPDGVDIGCGSLFTDYRGDSGSMSDSIHKIGVLDSFVEEDTAFDLLNVRMIRVDTTIDDGNANSHRRARCKHLETSGPSNL